MTNTPIVDSSVFTTTVYGSSGAGTKIEVISAYNARNIENKLNELKKYLNYLKTTPHTHDDVKTLVNAALDTLNN